MWRGATALASLGGVGQVSVMLNHGALPHAISLGCLVGFAALPLILLGLRATRPKLMPWWAVVLIGMGLGWGLLCVSALVQESREGGAGHVGALFLGWALVLVWFAPWLLLYAIVQAFRRRRPRVA